jgi:hypothetical protein
MIATLACVLLAAPAAYAEDAPAAQEDTKAATAPSPAAAPAKPAPAAKTPAATPPRTTAGKAAPRTLEDIRIEGDIPVPQVLFITARDQRRFMDLHHRRYLPSSLSLGERTVVPTTLTVLRTPVSGDRKEQSP